MILRLAFLAKEESASPMQPHEIQLRGPWQAQVLSRTSSRAGDASSGEESFRQDPPCDWSDRLGADFVGTVRYQRRFGTPTGLVETSKVWLVIEPPNDSAQITLNDQALGSVAFGATPFRCEIRRFLQENNDLVVDVHKKESPADTAEPAGGLVGRVYLEIVEADSE